MNKEHPITTGIGQRAPSRGLLRLGTAHISESRVINRQMRWHVLLDLIEYYKYNKIVEVGSQEGRTPWYILTNTSRESVEVTLVDPYILYDNYGYVEPFSMSVVEKQAKAYLDEFVKSGRCHFHKEYSVDAAKLFDDHSLDLVFIDANHTYEHVTEDLAAWYPKIRDGGILSGHDWSDDFPGVEKAVREYFEPKKKDILLSHNNVWVIKK